MTLAEILLAIALTTVSVLAILGLMSYSLGAGKKTSVHTQAASVASTLMSDLQVVASQSFDSVNEQPSTPVPPEIDMAGGGFTYRIAVTDLEPSATPPFAPALKDVFLTVNWKDNQGEQRFELQTRFARE